MAMDTVLELQKLEIPQDAELLGSSCTSSWSNCCKEN
jgi:hypothetical protein